MKKLILASLVFLFCSCNEPPKGTIEKISESENIELHKFYYTDGGCYVFVARFKDSPNVNTTTWTERRGKQTIQCTTISIDTIQ